MKERLRSLIISAAVMASLFSAQAASFVTFREGVNGYAGTQDTFISSGAPTTDNGNATTIEIDQEGDGGEFLLLRFDNLFGTGTNQIPAKSKILFASLTVQITNTGNEPKMHRMLVPWKETNTWESMIDGILADDVEAAVTEDQGFPGNGAKTVIPLLISTLQDWSNGTKTNYGWVFLPGGTDGTDFSSSENSNVDERPLLTVVWSNVDEPYVSSLSPLNGATGVPVDANIAITIVDGATPRLNPTSVQLFVNGQSVKPVLDKPADTNATTLVYDSPTNFPPNAKIPIRLIYGDTATPPHLSTNDFTFTTRANTTTLVAIDDKQVWRYDRTGTDLGTNWTAKTFNDSAWEQGMALIAEESGATAEPIRTPISRFSDAGDYLQTIYFRTHFTYTGPLGGDLILRHVVDDGAVFYLNGVEIHRFGLAAGAALDFTTSFAGHENAYEGPFTIPATSLVAGDNVFAVEVHQSGTGSSDLVFGAELLVAPSTATTTPPVTNQTTVNLIAIDDKQSWRYENTGKDLGTNWTAKTFNDTAWPQGFALLAAETGATPVPIRTTLVRANAAGENIITDYFRTHFTFTGTPANTQLKLRHVVDDGLVMYINGTEVYRIRVAAGQTYTTLAGDHENAYEGPFDIPSTALVSGDNVIAVEVHQTSATSSDVVFGIELQAVVTGPSTAAPKFTAVSRTGTNLNLTWTGTGILQSATAVAGPWTDVANAQSPFTAAISGVARFYRLR
jgi:hypothetical protein